MKHKILFLMILSFIFTGSLNANEEHQTPSPKPASAEFEKIKALAGTWKGTVAEKDGKTESAEVNYKVTSNGSAVVETLFPGTPMEMVSIYHDDENGKLSMTHYCAIGNQPQLDLKKSHNNMITLDLSSKSKSLESAQHMHALALNLAKPGEMVQTWTCFDGGKVNHTTTIDVKKV